MIINVTKKIQFEFGKDIGSCRWEVFHGTNVFLLLYFVSDDQFDIDTMSIGGFPRDERVFLLFRQHTTLVVFVLFISSFVHIYFRREHLSFTFTWQLLHMADVRRQGKFKMLEGGTVSLRIYCLY